MITCDFLDLDVCFATRLNLLLTGPDGVTDAFVKALCPPLQDPVVTLRGGEPFALPSAFVGTLFLVDVGALTLDEQRRLYEWLEERSGGTQVISMSAISLMPMVAAGRFLEELYYRLNTIYVEITDRHLASVPLRIPAQRSG
jgi:hypothetical protein